MRASLIVFALVLDITTAGKLHLPLQPQQTCSDTKRYSASTIAGGKILVKVLLSRPASMRDEVDAECCSIGNGNVGLTEYYTLVDAGPSRGHKDENDYICTVFDSDPSDPEGIRVVPGNASTTAAHVPAAADPDPHCEQRNTMEECWQGASPSTPGTCAWWGDACHDGPPLDCATLPELVPQMVKPVCVSVALAPGPIPAGSTPSGRTLRPFNWTSGTISGPTALNVKVAPAQVLKRGDSTWWSLDGGGNASYETCVTYNELLADASGSDPHSGFSACVDRLVGTGFDLRTGTSSNIAPARISLGVQAAGHPYANSTKVFWLQFAFWSNSSLSSSPSAPVGTQGGIAVGHSSVSLPESSSRSMQ